MNARTTFLAVLAALALPFALLAADPPPRIAFSYTDRAAAIQLPDTKGSNCWVIEASSDFVHWDEIGEMVEVDGLGQFPDELSRLFKKRYYRAVHRGRDIQAALNRNRACWERSGINDYDLKFQWLCFCAPDYVAPVNISVRDGRITSVTRAEDGVVVDPADFARYHTIDGLFDFIQDAIDLKAHKISARFAPRTGVPRRSWIDYHRGIVDEERGFVIEEFRIAHNNLVQITDIPPAELQLDPFSLQRASIRGDKLTLNLQHGGGCAEHDYELFMSPSVFMESFPVQANLYLRHNANGDLCKALLLKELTFDISPIVELYGQPGPIILNVYNYFTDEPGEKTQVIYNQSAVKITDTPPDQLQLNPFSLAGATINGDTVTLSVAHSGGCKQHTYELFMSPDAFLKSRPPQANLYLRHNANGDMCEAWIQNELSFNLEPISRLYGQPGRIVLNIYDYYTGDPVDRVRVNYDQ